MIMPKYSHPLNFFKICHVAITDFNALYFMTQGRGQLCGGRKMLQMYKSVSCGIFCVQSPLIATYCCTYVRNNSFPSDSAASKCGKIHVVFNGGVVRQF